MNSNRREQEEIRRLLVRGVAAAKAGEAASAQYYLETALNRRPRPDQEAEASYWLSTVRTDPEEKRRLLEHVLAILPNDPRARRELAILGGQLHPDDIVSADNLPNNISSEPIQTNKKRFECPTCGARLIYTPDGHGLQCENCGYRAAKNGQPARHTEIPEKDFILGLATLKGHHSPNRAQVFECSACGADYLLEPDALSFTCPHCESTYTLLHTKQREIISPSGILPPLITRGAAEDYIRQWWASHQLPKNNTMGKLAGVFYPIWSFDIVGSPTWNAEIYENQEWRHTKGNKLADFDDLLVPATRQVPPHLEAHLLTYNTRAAVPGGAESYPGWLSETHSLTMSDAAIQARSLALRKLRSEIRRDLPGNHRQLQVSSLNLNITQYKLLLLPLWISHYALNGSRFAVHVDAHDGRVFGGYPPTRLEKILNWFKKT